MTAIQKSYHPVSLDECVELFKKLEKKHGVHKVNMTVSVNSDNDFQSFNLSWEEDEELPS